MLNARVIMFVGAADFTSVGRMASACIGNPGGTGSGPRHS